MKFKAEVKVKLEKIDEIIESTQNSMLKHTANPELIFKNLKTINGLIEQTTALINRETEEV